MARSSCPACGATVQVALVQTPLSGAIEERVVLEVSTDASSDADRYRIVELNPLTAERVARGARGDFLPDHAWDCPGGNSARHAGRR